MKNQHKIEGRNVLVTGATSGLGHRFALILARAGARVAIAGRRGGRLEELEAEIEAFDGRAVPLVVDVNDRAAVLRAIDVAETELGPLGILINNAGTGDQTPITEVTEAEYDRVMDTNLKAPFFIAQEVARRMIAHGQGGSIVNIASIAAQRPVPHLSVYCTSKAGLAHLTRCMALEWARFGINVNAICPGYIRTEINQELFDSERGKEFVARFPRRRVGRPEDLDDLLLLLAGGTGSFITGSLITADDAQSLL